MPPIAFLALLTIVLLAFAAFRLELDFRRTCKEGAGPVPSAPRPEHRPRAPELRAAPAGGYWQAPSSPRPFTGAAQARRAGFAL
jgi:hypothetical protein